MDTYIDNLHWITLGYISKYKLKIGIPPSDWNDFMSFQTSLLKLELMLLTPLEVWRTRCFVKNLYLADTCRRLRTAPPPSLHLLRQITDLYLLRFERRVPGNTTTVALSSSKQQCQTSLTVPDTRLSKRKFRKLKLQINSIKQWKNDRNTIKTKQTDE